MMIMTMAVIHTNMEYKMTTIQVDNHDNPIITILMHVVWWSMHAIQQVGTA